MEKSFGLFFHLKKENKYNGEELPVYMRITVNGTRCEVSTKRKASPLNWNVKAGRLDGKGEVVKIFNTYLDTLQQQVYDAKRKLMDSGDELTAENIKSILLGIEKPKEVRMLLKIFTQHNEQIRTLIGQEYALATYKKYKTTYTHVEDFLKEKYNLDDVEITKLDYEFITEFEFWLKSISKCNQNSTIKYVTNFRKIIFRCVRNGWLIKDPFLGFRMKKKEIDRTALTQHELDIIKGKIYHNERLRLVRDIFLFSCYTGLSYADVEKLKRTEIMIGVDGEEWIFTSRQKTDSSSRIPLLPVAKEIIEQYKFHPHCKDENRLLPILSNQKMNSYLKEIADGCKINKNLTYHIARHTFATTITLSNGVPIETVAKMLGHRNLRTTQHYAKILDNKISDDMKGIRKIYR